MAAHAWTCLQNVRAKVGKEQQASACYSDAMRIGRHWLQGSVGAGDWACRRGLGHSQEDRAGLVALPGRLSCRRPQSHSFRHSVGPCCLPLCQVGRLSTAKHLAHDASHLWHHHTCTPHAELYPASICDASSNCRTVGVLVHLNCKWLMTIRKMRSTTGQEIAASAGVYVVVAICVTSCTGNPSWTA